MSKLTDRIAAEHDTYLTYLTGGDLRASCEGCDWTFEGDSIDAVVECSRHVPEVTEAAVREQVAREIEEAEVWAVRTDLLDRWGTSLGGRRIMSPHRAHMIVQLVRADAARIARGGAV